MATMALLGSTFIWAQLTCAAPPGADGERALVEALTAASEPPARERPAARPAAAAVVSAPALDEGLGAALKLAAMAVLAGGVVAGATLLARRLGGDSAEKKEGRSLRLVETLWLGKGQRLLLVTVGRERVLLGVSAGNIRPLGQFPEGAGAVLAPARGGTRSGLEKTLAPVPEDKEHPSFLQDDDFVSAVQGELRRQTLSGRERRQQILQRLNTL